eukprot:gene3464-3940_t
MVCLAIYAYTTIFNLRLANYYRLSPNQTTHPFSIIFCSKPLAYIEKIVALEPIPGADIIEIATVLGWRVIVKKGLYSVNDLVVYVEIDSILPAWSYFISDRLDKCQFKIKTIKMRGQISQGYCIPIKELLNHPTKPVKPIYNVDGDVDSGIKEIVPLDEKEQAVPIQLGTNVTDFIGIRKIAEHTYGGGGGIFRSCRNENLHPFPAFVRKTDQPRIQNMPHFMETYGDLEFEITEKLEGSSITVYYFKGRTGICSRNYELANLDDQSEIHQVLVGQLNILERLEEAKLNIAIQGEFIGPKIQGNFYGLNECMWKAFDVFLIDLNRYATQEERVQVMAKIGLPWSEHGVPYLGTLKIAGKSMKDILDMAPGVTQLKASKPK